MQVARPGAIDPSVYYAEEDREIIGKVRKKVWYITAGGYFAVFILWPCLTVMLPVCRLYHCAIMLVPS